MLRKCKGIADLHYNLTNKWVYDIDKLHSKTKETLIYTDTCSLTKSCPFLLPCVMYISPIVLEHVIHEITMILA